MQEPAGPDGPPKARTDAERAADNRAARSPDTERPSPVQADDSDSSPAEMAPAPARAQEQVDTTAPAAAKKTRRKAPGDAKPKPRKKKKTAANDGGASDDPASSGNGSTTATPAETPDKPTVRLLPWEPAAPHSDEGADKPAEPPVEAGEKTTETDD